MAKQPQTEMIGSAEVRWSAIGGFYQQPIAIKSVPCKFYCLFEMQNIENSY